MVTKRLTIAALLAATLAGTATAQQRPQTGKPTMRRRQAPIEIRGAVPTPQVVTVRPREVPAYDRQVLVPRYYDHDFWPEIQQGYQLLPDRFISGNANIDSVNLRVDSVGIPQLFKAPSVQPPSAIPDRWVRVRRQARWCAPAWWCPVQRTRVRQPLDSSLLIQTLPQPDTTLRRANPAPPMTGPPEVRQKWCTPRWWCGDNPVRATPDTTRRAPATTPRTPAPRDTTRRAPADTTRRPPGTPPALRQR